jgi:hypothetical protein
MTCGPIDQPVFGICYRTTALLFPPRIIIELENVRFQIVVKFYLLSFAAGKIINDPSRMNTIKFVSRRFESRHQIAKENFF